MHCDGVMPHTKVVHEAMPARAVMLHVLCRRGLH